MPEPDGAMSEAIDFYRRQLTHANIRVRLAEDDASALRLQLQLANGALGRITADNDRLRRLAERVQAELAEMRERLRDAETARAGVTLDELIRSVGAAVENAAPSLQGRAVTALHAQLRLALAAGDDGPGLAIAPPGIYPTPALSTVSIEFRAVPPSAAEEALRSATGLVLFAVLDLQRKLAGDFPEEARARAVAALAHASAYAAAPPAPGAVAAALEPLSRGLVALAGHLPSSRAAAEELERRRSAPAVPGQDNLRPLAEALMAVGAALG